MKFLLAILLTIAACLFAVPDAQAGPLCGIGRAALHIAALPSKAVGKSRANRIEAREARR